MEDIEDLILSTNGVNRDVRRRFCPYALCVQFLPAAILWSDLLKKTILWSWLIDQMRHIDI
jgi:hypothetical protein